MAKKEGTAATVVHKFATFRSYFRMKKERKRKNYPLITE
jgi:hypothetical protein